MGTAPIGSRVGTERDLKAADRPVAGWVAGQGPDRPVQAAPQNLIATVGLSFPGGEPADVSLRQHRGQLPDPSAAFSAGASAPQRGSSPARSQPRRTRGPGPHPAPRAEPPQDAPQPSPQTQRAQPRRRRSEEGSEALRLRRPGVWRGAPSPANPPGCFPGNRLHGDCTRPPTLQPPLAPSCAPRRRARRSRGVDPAPFPHCLEPSPAARPPRPTWSPKKAECSRLRSPRSPMEQRQPRTSRAPPLGRQGGGAGRGPRGAGGVTPRVWGGAPPERGAGFPRGLEALGGWGIQEWERGEGTRVGRAARGTGPTAQGRGLGESGARGTEAAAPCGWGLLPTGTRDLRKLVTAPESARPGALSNHLRKHRLRRAELDEGGPP
ncbi:hypothetical protein P7K49_032774 [Saguinus oedipus]|uniref:Basic proline-rich protein-like n=1 Tax=Saguinus oedipus TaxID=9490 RepID=A0ABQ9TQ07_SAGOE|nr:hypothetical protein P7K49_032774 [Saguinus oedipus]